MHERLKETLQTILSSCRVVEDRAHNITVATDFLRDEHGQLLLDSIAMRLQVVGENVKGISKIAPEFLDAHPQINWKAIMRLRDFLSHHYDTIDYELVYDICKTKVPELRSFLEQVLS